MNDAPFAPIGAILTYMSPFLLAALAGLGALYKMERDKRLAIEAKIDEKKVEIYTEFIENYSALFFDLAAGNSISLRL